MFFTQEDYRKIEKWLLANSVKDTEFAGAATPLKGNEILAIVQNGQNMKVSLKDFIDQLFLLGVSDFVNITDKYGESYLTLSQAIQLIPFRSRKIGQVITFLDEDGEWKLSQFQGERVNQWNNATLWVDLIERIQGISIIDSEDITATVDNLNQTSLTFADKNYNTTDYSGLGRVYLRKNIVDIEDLVTGNVVTINWLNQSMISKENTIYIIQYDYNLNGQTITIPNGCVLLFEGGSISNGNLVGQIQREGYIENYKGDNDKSSILLALSICETVYLKRNASYEIVDNFTVPEGRHLIGNNTTLNLYAESSSVLMGLKDNTEIIGLNIVSHAEDLEWNRLDLTGGKNIKISKCSISGFRNPTKSNSWGIYMKNSKNIIIEDCTLANNTQSDIAITEKVYDVYITRTKCSTINIEPNTVLVSNINVLECVLDSMYILNNSITEEQVEGININMSIIGTLFLKGGRNVRVASSDITHIQHVAWKKYYYWMGTIDIDNEKLGRNLILSPHMLDLKETFIEGFWTRGWLTEATNISRKIVEGRKVTALNSREISKSSCSIKTKITCKPDEYYKIVLKGALKCVYGENYNSLIGNVSYYSEDDSIIESHEVSCFIHGKLAEGETLQTDFGEYSLYIHIPEGATYFILALNNARVGQKGPNTLFIEEITCRKVESSPISEDIVDVLDVMPEYSNLFSNKSIVGDTFCLQVDGEVFPQQYKCIKSGNPGVFINEDGTLVSKVVTV
jgi:parallel beta-helix repeat protein